MGKQMNTKIRNKFWNKQNSGSNIYKKRGRQEIFFLPSPYYKIKFIAF